MNNKATLKTTFYGSRFQWCKCVSFFLSNFNSAEAFYRLAAAFQSEGEAKQPARHVFLTGYSYVFQEIKYTGLFLQTKGKHKASSQDLPFCYPKKLQIPSNKVRVHSITSVNHQIPGESL